MKAKRILSLLLTLILVFSLFPAPAVAAGEGAGEQAAQQADPPSLEEPTKTAEQPTPEEPAKTENPNPVKADRAFTKQPTGGSIAPNGNYKFTWKTNFTPVKIEICKMQTDDWFPLAFKSLSGTATSYTISYDVAAGYGSATKYSVRA